MLSVGGKGREIGVLTNADFLSQLHSSLLPSPVPADTVQSMSELPHTD